MYLSRDALFEGEYEPLADVVPDGPRVMVARLLVRFVLALTALLLSVIGLARLLPPPLLLAYEVTTPQNTREVMLFDARTQVQAAFLNTEMIREARWLPDGTGLLLLEARSWAVHGMDGDIRNPASTERIGMRAQPAPDWSRALSMERGQLVLFNGRTSRVLLQGNPADIYAAIWSPDSTHIAANVQASQGDSALREVLLLNVDTGEAQVLSSEPAFYTSLRWAPDGTRLAFIDLRYDIQLVDIATGDLTRLPYPHIETIDTLSWTPDGTALIYATRAGRLYLLDVATGSNMLIEERLASNTQLAWSPDGQWLAISTGTLVEHTLYLRDMRTGQMLHMGDHVRAGGLLAWQP